MLFLLTWNAIFALVYYTNRPTRTLNNSTDFRLHQMLQKTTSRLIALYKDQLRWDYSTFSSQKRRFQEALPGHNQDGESWGGVLESSYQVSSSRVSRRARKAYLSLRENFRCFFPWPNWLPLGSLRIPFRSPWHFFSLPTPYVPTETFTSHWLNMACKDGDLNDHWSNEERSPFRSYLRI